MHKHSMLPRLSFRTTLARTLLRAVLLVGLLGMTPVAPVMAGIPKPEPFVVKDIYPGPLGSDPYVLTAVGSQLFFAAFDEPHGDELWRSDGKEANTVLVKDIYPGGFNSHPENMTDVNGTLFFSANDKFHGEELWRSDGTEMGTEIVKDIYPGSGGSVSRSGVDWVVFNGLLYFIANDGTHGDELWQSDGTQDGTLLVKDIFPGINGANSYQLISANGMLFFDANDGTHGKELWRSDGSEAGTMLVKDIIPGGSDGTFNYYNMAWVAVNNTLFFGANEGTNGYELWSSDGSEAGTKLVKDIYPGGDNSMPSNLTSVGDTLFFAAVDGTNGYELWRSDGTEAGTALVKDINPGIYDSVFGYSNLMWIAAGDTLFFQADDGISGYELWRSDGTEPGTILVKDIYSGNYGSDPRELINLNGTLYFVAYDAPHGPELWMSDGSDAGTQLVKDIYPGNIGSRPRYLTNVNGALFFTATNFDFFYYYPNMQSGIIDDAPFGIELWSLGYFSFMPVMNR